MITNEDIRAELVARYVWQRGLLKDHNSTIEIINANFQVTEDHIIREPNKEYIARELEWYLSQSLNVNDIPGDTPKIWKEVSSNDGYINSNYGWCIFSKTNGNQYYNVLSKLESDSENRQSTMIYTRPNMHYDAIKDGMKDFMCTCYTHHFIRNNELIYIVYQRSCDAVFGYNNDVAWHKYVHNKLHTDLLKKYPDLKLGDIFYNVGSLHVYPRHFKELDKLAKEMGYTDNE